jgi:hypothetical protein
MNASTERGRFVSLDFLLPLGLLLALGTVVVIDCANRGMFNSPLEVVLILDEGSGLADSADGIKQNWLRIAESLTAASAGCRFAVLPCHPDSKQIPRIPLIDDLDLLKRQLASGAAEPGTQVDPWPETDCLQALEDVLNFEFREDASPLVFITTSAPQKDHDRLSRLAAKYRERGIKVIVQGDGSDQAFFRPLYKDGGQFFTLAGQNLTEPSATKTDQAASQIGTLLSASGGGSAEEPQLVQFIAGVKVKGEIALVCDISGSMHQDFPPLVAELRSKFPKDTPLILVPGCVFLPPNAGNLRPTKIRDSSLGATCRVAGVDFASDDHVYYAASTTDAILMAVKLFRRDTVMFNNDLQDGGSLRAIAAFEELLQQRRFTLSGRSLNRDAPDELKAFIRKTGGDFKVDPINRAVAPAINWSR